MRRREIPIFFAADNNYAPILAVAIRSLIANSCEINRHRIIVLTPDLSEDNTNKIKELATVNCKIDVINIYDRLNDLGNDFSEKIRKYCDNSLYYRIFIPSLFPNYEKALYLDCDIAVVKDISFLYYELLYDNMVGAVVDDVINSNDIFKRYTKCLLGVDSDKYFNSGIMVMNLIKLREEHIDEKFIDLINTYDFSVISNVQDFMNYLCKDKVKYLPKCWNRMAIIPDDKFQDRNLNLVHYTMYQKPWNYSGVHYEKHFWKYAKETPYYDEIKAMKSNYSQENIKKDAQYAINTINKASNIIEAKKTFSGISPD